MLITIMQDPFIVLNLASKGSIEVSTCPIFSPSQMHLQNLNNLITVVAVAADDPNANIIYSQVMRGVPSDGFFTVTPAGVVNVVGNLDRETEGTYDVQIQVRTNSFFEIE